MHWGAETSLFKPQTPAGEKCFSGLFRWLLLHVHLQVHLKEPLCPCKGAGVEGAEHPARPRQGLLAHPSGLVPALARQACRALFPGLHVL